MIVVGPYIEITKPRPTEHTGIITERGAIEKAIVVRTSPDIKVPFKEGDWLYFFTGKPIKHREHYIVHIDMCVLYFDVS